MRGKNPIPEMEREILEFLNGREGIEDKRPRLLELFFSAERIKERKERENEKV
jgi:hypothetical protein